MRKNIITLCIIFITSLLIACNNAEYSSFDNSIYMTEAYGGNFKTLTVSKDGAETTVSVRTAQVTNDKIQATIGISSEALERFNLKNHTDYKLLPSEYFELSAQQVEIETGKIYSEPIKIKVKADAWKLLEKDEHYAIAATIVTFSPQNIPMPDNLRTCVFVCKKSKSETQK